jgi:hypothetical protein
MQIHVYLVTLNFGFAKHKIAIVIVCTIPATLDLQGGLSRKTIITPAS